MDCACKSSGVPSVNGFVNKAIDGRFAELVHDEQDLPSKKKNSIIDLVLTTYLSENAASKIQGMDSTFKKFTVSQIKLFLFSGHDTTSSTVCYIFYVLATRPDVLTKVRAEHHAVIGPDSTTTSVINANPFLLNQLPYTIAVIKEVMRLYPAVSGTRTGESGFSVTDHQGRHFPTQDFLVWDNPQVVHRDPTYWHNPDELIPERWLEGSERNLHPVKGAWRAFSHGPDSVPRYNQREPILIQATSQEINYWTLIGKAFAFLLHQGEEGNLRTPA